ncbi:hypothetical protein UWK_03218 [Desulfocapsa sulfexigens DSM 10523]|uniref:Uncharacterized protein n=1 Tax=Desulfocapsa sulfexigens (strain DSM 10523 / SB164P1) TaxID=1167006 RepID=M1PJK6_DESSD|nr:hypothetical protein UWK_03218 [Desulfocapsa sulfexigens DSM 10523]
MVAAATRATIKKIDLTTIRGKKVNLYVSAIGDTGAGNLIGGRFSLVSQVRGDYIQSPPVIEKSTFRRYQSMTSGSSTSTTDSQSSDQNTKSRTSSSSRSSTDSVLAVPEQKHTETTGSGNEIQIGLEYKGLGAYHNSEEITSDDLQYLSGLLQTYFFLQGVAVVPPSEAEIDVYVTVDVFGTVRTRIEWFLANNEILRAKTALEVMAIDHLSGQLVMVPQSASVEAEYNEQYILWAGPIMITKYLHASEPLLSDFTDLNLETGSADYPEQNGDVPYPFQHQIDKWRERE